MKLSSVSGRGARKDFIDIYAIGQSGLELSQMLNAFEQKYAMDIGHIVMSLTYFDDAEQDDMPEMLWPVVWDEIKAAITRWVSGILPPKHRSR